ncbi:Carboxylesterase PA3859 [hydrothermal vent metagenome]|uniref:Carboxylesterase PA3859 n=1 Tax=hydrothermal vent metagenome TaxID=652676 RepID=A0A3B0WAB0_9ZZZZ
MQETKRDLSIMIEPKGEVTSVVIWLHGLGADGHDFAGLVPQLNLPEYHGIRFVFPHAPVQAVTINGGMEMRSWYDIRSTDFMNDVDAAGIRVSCYQIYDLIQTQLDQGIEANKIVLAGFSQGGLIALHAGLSFSHRLAGIMALSTYCSMHQQFSQHRDVPIFMAHGEFDSVIPFAVAHSSYKALTKRGYGIQWQSYPMEHQVCAQEIEDIVNWLTSILL